MLICSCAFLVCFLCSFVVISFQILVWSHTLFAWFVYLFIFRFDIYLFLVVCSICSSICSFLCLIYRNFRTINRDFFPQLLTLRLKQRMRLIYGFFSIWGASHPRLFLASFQLASKRRAAIRTCLCSVLFISKVSQKFISIFKYSVEWSIHNNF